jgi:hypothetical protein
MKTGRWKSDESLQNEGIISPGRSWFMHKTFLALVVSNRAPTLRGETERRDVGSGNSARAESFVGCKAYAD